MNLNENNSADTSSSSKHETQLITLQANSTSSLMYKITSKEAEIRASKNLSQYNVIASNKIKVNKIVSYEWENKYNHGNIVAAHKNDQFFAYSLKGKTGYNVRIFHKKSNLRSLLPPFSGKIIDLSFADCDETILGCIDEAGNAKIFKIELDSTPNIQSQLLLHILPPASSLSTDRGSDIQRFIWCMYISDPEDVSKIYEDDASKVFIVTRDRQADIYHLDLILQDNKDDGVVHHADDITKGHLRVKEHESTILTASFSPDGSAISTASINGDVNFFKISFTDNCAPTCLQKWKPHESRPVTSLFFLDDHKNSSPNAQFWRYVLTGCDYNREIKLWCCIKWQCLQTIRFTSDDDDVVPCLKAAIDFSSRFLVMSDIKRKVFYVLHLLQDANDAKISSISEYQLTCPALCYAIVDSKTIIAKKFNRIASSSNEENCENELVEYSTIQLYCIQTSQLQEMEIMVSSDNTASSAASDKYNQSPSMLSNVNQRASSSYNSDLKDRFTDVHSDLEQDLNTSRNNIAAVASNSNNFILNKENQTLINTNNGISPGLNLSNPSTPILLTPDAFSNSQKRLNSGGEIGGKSADMIQSFMSNSSRASSLTHVTSCVNNNNANAINSTKIIQQPMISVVGQSSLLTTTTHHDNFDEAKKMNEEKKIIYDHQPKRLLSSSSSSSHSSSGLSLDAADKEIEAISLPVVDYKTQNSNEIVNEYLYADKKPLATTISPNLNTNGLLSKVDILDNDYENENEDCSLILATNAMKLSDEQPRNWPNPPILGAKASKRNESLVNTKTDQSSLLHEIVHLMRTQQNEIEVLKKQQINTTLSLKTHFDSVIQSTRMQNVASASHSASSSMLVNEENFCSIVNQALATQIVPKLEGIIKDEIRQSIQPQVIKIIEPFREQIPRELAEKLSATENLLKDSIAKMFKSKGFLDSISQSVGNGIQSTIVNAYRDSFQKVVIPSFEKSCQGMYQQINTTFKKGSDDYIQELENYLKQQRKLSEEHKDPLISQLKQYNETLQTSLTQLNSTLTNSLYAQVEQNLRTSNAILQDTIISSVKAIIKEELNVAMRDQQQHLPEHLVSLMRQSGTMTPVVFSQANEYDTKQRLQALIQSGQYNSAFQKALCASDLNLLISVCEMVSSSDVFSQKPCPLQQQVLLSLIQQLSQELHLHTELKVSYLEYACVSLDYTNQVTREHIPSIISVLQQKISNYLSAHPNEKPTIVQKMRILLMASNSFKDNK